MIAARDTWLNPAASVLLCAASGALCARLRLPVPWMIGPLLAMAACNFAGARLRAPAMGRPAGQTVIGVALGLYFTPAVAAQVAAYWPLLLAAAVFAIAVGWVSGGILRRATGVDGVTAFFASVPGGAAEMTLLGERLGAKPDRVALAQSLRILVVVVLVPFALTYSGAHGADRYDAAATAVDWGALALLLVIAAAAGGTASLAKIPNPFMLGPLFASIVLTANQIHFSSVPSALSNAAQVLIGCALGTRFEQRYLRSMPRYVIGVLLSVLAAVGVSAAFGAALAWIAGLAVPSAVLATAPGGIAEMCITAKVLQLGVPLVTAAHIARVIILVSTTGITFRIARSLAARNAER